MLSSADRALAERDPEMPGLSVVLDPDAVTALAAGTDGPRVVGARPTYVRYKPATSCVVGYELFTVDGPVLVYAKAYAPGAAAKLVKATEKEVRDERWGTGVVPSDEHGVLLAAAASDRDLPALKVLSDSTQRERLMSRLLPDDPDLWHQEARAIRHKPERRWVGLVERDRRPVALIKAYRAADLRRSRAGHRQLATAAVRPLGWSRRRAALALSWVEGTSLAELLFSDIAEDHGAETAAVGSALAALHATSPDGELDGNGWRSVAATLGPAAETVGNLLPYLDARARRLATAVASELVIATADRCVVHGDFSADQVVIAGEAVHLIDFDQAQVADPAADVASFNAGLIRAEIEGQLRRGRAAELSACLLDEHQRCGGPSIRQRLIAHQAGALLRLAVAPFRERHPDWPDLCEALIGEAERSLSPVPAVGGRRWH
ncbi:hypothetical protein BH18ACT3_BH18ACT3_27230 [soil metagenome]